RPANQLIEWEIAIAPYSPVDRRPNIAETVINQSRGRLQTLRRKQDVQVPSQRENWPFWENLPAIPTCQTSARPNKARQQRQHGAQQIEPLPFCAPGLDAVKHKMCDRSHPRHPEPGGAD